MIGMGKCIKIFADVHAAPILQVLLTLSFVANLMPNAIADEIPAYKPSVASIAPVDITTNAYGQSPLAPNALGIGEIAPDFSLPRSGNGEYQLAQQASHGSVAIVFYRGHW